MRRADKVIISCAITGGIHTPSMSPYLPVTPAEITAHSVAAADTLSKLLGKPVKLASASVGPEVEAVVASLLEGEVLLEVEFAANGQLHVNRVVRGLGHGLDETAVAAANKMRFKPALRNGQAIDSTAIVHVVFQLAY